MNRKEMQIGLDAFRNIVYPVSRTGPSQIQHLDASDIRLSSFSSSALGSQEISCL